MSGRRVHFPVTWRSYRRSTTPTLRETSLAFSLPPFPFIGAGAPRVVCRACHSSAAVRRVAVPFVFRYLATELAAMNIKTTLAISS